MEYGKESFAEYSVGKASYLLPVVAILGIAIIAFFGVLYFGGQEQAAVVPANDGTAVEKQLRGKIYATLLPKDASLQGLPGIPQAYSIDLQAKTFQRVNDGLLFSAQHIFSSDGSYVGFLGLDPETTQDLSDFYSLNLHVYRGENDSLEVRNTQNISAREGFTKYTPAISNEGKLLYALLKDGNTTAQEPRFADITTPDVWDIYLIDGAGKERKLTQGVYPHWVGQSKFVYLRNDGLYYYDLETGAETQLVPNTSSTPFSNSSMLDVSDSGELIVWSLPATASVLLLEAHDWGQEGGPTLYTRYTFRNLFGFWPVFSPDGNHFAIESINPTNNYGLNNPHPRLLFFDTSSFEKLEHEIDLNAYDQMEMYITDWK